MGVENSILDRLRFGERPFSTVLEYLNCVCLRIDGKNDCCMHVHSRDNRDIRRTLNSTPGPSRLDTMHISRYNTGIEVVSSAKLLGVVVLDNLRWPERACRIYLQKGCDAPVLPKTAKAR